MMPSTTKAARECICTGNCCWNGYHCRMTGCNYTGEPFVNDAPGPVEEPPAPKKPSNEVWERKLAKQRRREAFEPLGRPRRK